MSETISVHNMLFPGELGINSMNNLSSYCGLVHGLVDAKIRASDKDLTVQIGNRRKEHLQK